MSYLLFPVTDSPSVEFSPSHSPYRVKLNSAVTLQCVVYSNPSYSSIEWTKDGSPISGTIYFSLSHLYRILHMLSFTGVIQTFMKQFSGASFMKFYIITTTSVRNFVITRIDSKHRPTAGHTFHLFLTCLVWCYIKQV